MDTSKNTRYISIPLSSYSAKNLNNPVLKVISTELRSPISVIQSNIQLLKKNGDHSDQSLFDDTLGLCEDSVESILGFIENMNFLIDSTIPKMNSNPKQFLIRMLIKNAIEELKYLNFDVSRLQYQLMGEFSSVLFDKYKLTRILVNLLGNAMKFSRREVLLTVESTKKRLVIIVRDFGIGIPEHQLNDIFNPFVRGSNAHMISGTGLGLSIVAKSLECFGGTIALRSEINMGTEIKVVIPVKELQVPVQKIASKKSNIRDFNFL
jgi:signal transduction histidine kinase